MAANAATLRPRKAVMEQDENGFNIITERFLKELCEENNQFVTPHLNDTLYLHYKGFKKIQGLDKYVNIKSIWLECNGIQKIENLDHLVKLRMMYLHQNQIERIEGLGSLVNLMTLNLSHNRIKRVENLASLPLLKNIDLSNNLIGANEDGAANPLDCIEEFKECKALTSIDLSNNIMDCEHGVIEFFVHCQNILCLYLKGNPCVRRISMYRKRLTYTLKNLQYLDDRPVFEIERIAANAWSEGGAEAEKVARDKYQQEKIDKMKSYTQRGRELTEEARAKRKEQMRRMLESLKKDKDELIRKRDELKALHRTMHDDDQQKQITYMKIKKIEQDLETEYYKILEEKGELNDTPSVQKPKAPTNVKLFQEELDAELKKRKEINDEMKLERDIMEREIEQQTIINRIDEEEYRRRETNQGRPAAGGIIPSASPPRNNQGSPRNLKVFEAAGVVMSTDSEESERENDKRKKVPMQQFKWTPETEALLEETLMANFFDFHASAKQFSKKINESLLGSDQVWYNIDAKSLQLRWTDIEIRKYRLNQPTSRTSGGSDNEEDKQASEGSTTNNSFDRTGTQQSSTSIDDEEDDLPPLEEKPQNEKNNASTQGYQGNGAASSSDEDETKNGGKIAYYTNLEELD